MARDSGYLPTFFTLIFARTEWKLERHCKIKIIFLSWWVDGLGWVWVDELVSSWVDEYLSLRAFELLSWWVMSLGGDELGGWRVDELVWVVELMSWWACGFMGWAEFRSISQNYTSHLISLMPGCRRHENRNPDWPLANRGSYRFALQCKIILLREFPLLRRWGFPQQPQLRPFLLLRVFQQLRFRQQP